MDKTERLKNIAIAISSLVVPIFLGFIGHQYTKNLKEREIQSSFVELGVRILEQEPTKDNQNLRGWAVAVLNNYSGVPINENTKQELLKIPITTVTPIMSGEVTIRPGQALQFSSLTFSLGECQVGERIECHFQIDNSSDQRNLLRLKAHGLSEYTTRFLMRFGENEFSYAHGPMFWREFYLQPNERNEGGVVFESFDKSIENNPEKLREFFVVFLVKTADGANVLVNLRVI